MIVTSVIASVLLLCVVAAAWISRSALERFLYYFAGYFMNADIQSRIALVSPVSPDTLITKEGNLVSYFRIRGARRLIGPKDFDRMSEKMADIMQVILSDGTGNQHTFSIAYLSDPPGTPYQIKNLLVPARTTAKRMGAEKNASVWFDAREAFLGDLCNDETVVMAVYTLKSGLSPKESERYAQWMIDIKNKTAEQLKKDQVKDIANKQVLAGVASEDMFNQIIHPIYPVLGSRHNAMITNLISTIENAAGGIGVIVDALKGDEAIYCLRRFIDGSNIPPSWRPQLFGDKAPMSSTLERSGDLAHTMPISIARQIITEPMQEVFTGFEMVKRENLYYGSVKLDVCPQEEPNPNFSNLVDRMGKKFPFAVNFEVSPNGMNHKKMDQLFSAFFGGFGSHNRAMRDAWRELKAMHESGQYVATLRMVATTWAKDEDSLGDQLATLKMAIQSWGSSTVSNESGSPINLLLATAPGLARYNPAPYIPGPLHTFSRMLPLYRAASPWGTGQLLLRTSQGKPYPIAFGSTIQAFWGTLVFAPPGRGKSFLMNCLNAGILFSPGLSDLPYIVIIDKGMSSANVIEMAKGILPPDRQHQAISIRLRNTEDYAINVFDTQLGLDQPTQRERDFQVNLVSSLCPNLGMEGVAFIGQVVDVSYKTLNRESLSARRWQRAYSPEITDRLIEQGVTINDETSPRVWDVVDMLFDLGDPHAAVQAQRFAVPTMDDLVVAANHDQVRDMYGKTPSASGQELLIDVFIRSITTASREYALLSTRTRFDVGDARVISVDLEEVLASATSEEGRRRAATMMLFARQLGARNYFLKWDEMEKIVPKRYQRYQEARVKTIFETLKFLEYDEFHNAHGMTDVIRMVETDFREGRKYNVVPLLSSQLFGDFSKDLVDTANNYFILGVGSSEGAKKIQETFELSDAERLAIQNDCLGPGPKGAPLFAMFKTDKGEVSQLLYNSAAAIEQWAFNSSAMDVAVRKAVQEELGGNYWLMLKGLSQHFPNGTARHEIERMREHMGSDEEVDERGIAVTLAKRIAAKVREQEYASHGR